MDTNPSNRRLLKPSRFPQHRFAYIGIPHDAATSLGNPGARFGPRALREALRGIFGWRLQDGRLSDIERGIVDLSAIEVAALDIAELNPVYDSRARTTAILAARLLLDCITARL